MTVSIMDLVLLLICFGLMVVGNGFLVGWLVYRAKRESHETLAPMKYESGGAIHRDELAEDDIGFPDAITERMAKLKEAYGIDLKGGQ